MVRSFFGRFIFLMKPVLPTAVLAIALACVLPVYSQSVKERVWTNLNGKKIRAELLMAGYHSGDDTIQLRIKGGNIFKVDPATLIREDQALILKTIFEKSFRSRYNKDMGAHFFYSKQAGKEDNEKTVAYIGNDHRSAWMRMKVRAHPGLVNDGTRIMIIGEGHPVRINYTPEDVEAGRGNSSIDLSLTKYGENVSSLFSNPGRLKILIETESGRYTEVRLSKPEKQGLKEVADAFLTLSKLTTDHVWWTTFQGLDPEVFKKTLEDEAMAEAAAKKNNGSPVDSGPLLPSQEWNEERNQTVFTGELTGFTRHLAKFLCEGDSERLVPVGNFDKAGRELLVSTRQARALYESWHPYDDEYIWHWPKRWNESAERIEKQAILFAVNRETGDPGLFLQQRTASSSEESIVGCKLKSPGVHLDIDLHAGQSLKLRKPTGYIVWYRLAPEVVELFLVASPGMEDLEYEISLASGSVEKGKFSADEFRASIEALEIYRIRKSLIGETSPGSFPEADSSE